MPKKEAAIEKVHQRRQALLNLLQSEPDVLSIKDLAQRLGLNDKTVSYDMRVLTGQGQTLQSKDHSTRPPRLLFRSNPDAPAFEMKPPQKPGRPPKNKGEVKEKGQGKAKAAAPAPAKTKGQPRGKTREIDELLLGALGNQETHTVQQLSQQLGKTQAHVNQALTRLIKKGKVSRNRAGKKYMYALAGSSNGQKPAKASGTKTRAAALPSPTSLFESGSQPEFIKAAIDAFVDRILDAERRAWAAGKASKR